MKEDSQHSEEMRKRRFEALRRAWSDPEVRKRISENMRRAWADPEVRQRWRKRLA
jgi:hypothetical protein